MKTKHLTLTCIIALFSVDLAYGIWPGVDPHAENYYPQSPYSYVNNDPVRNIDPDGMDWYSFVEEYLDEEGKKKKRTQYGFTMEHRSQADLDKAGIKGTYIGLNKTVKNDDGSQTYLSLLGEQFASNTKEEKQVAKMVENLDETIKDYYKERFFYNSLGIRDERTHFHDMSVPGMKANPDFTTMFNYAGGDVRYRIADNMTGGTLNWGGGIYAPLRNYVGQRIMGVHAYVERNAVNKTFEVLHWTFPNPEKYNMVKDKAWSLLKGREGYRKY